MEAASPSIHKEPTMSSSSSAFFQGAKSYITRVAQNESTKRGLAAAVAGVLVSAVIEAWSTPRIS